MIWNIKIVIFILNRFDLNYFYLESIYSRIIFDFTKVKIQIILF